MGKKQFCFFQTAETGSRTPDSGVKGSGANHYPRAPALPVLQVRSLVWGYFDQHHAIEISRIKADIPPQRGGPATVTVVRVTDAG